MNKLSAEELLEKYNAGTASVEECHLVESWYAQQQSHNLPDAEDFLTDHFVIKDALMKHANSNRRQHFPLLRIAGIAAAVATVVFGLWFFIYRGEAPLSKDGLSYKNDIRPGKNGATLTLSNGHSIVLQDSKTGVVISSDMLNYEDGSVVAQSEMASVRASENLTASTTIGQTYAFTLSDGTKVWLNAASKLTFPSSFKQATERKVILEGEGYFEVAKDQKHPFLVRTPQQELQVLGTHFNINAYPGEHKDITTLVEGSVKINTATAEAFLKPQQQAIAAQNKPISISLANIRDELAWKNGYFKFYQLPITEIMTKLSRWYDIELEYKDIPGEKFSGTISRSKNISEVLNMLSYSGSVKFKVEGRRVTVMK